MNDVQKNNTNDNNIKIDIQNNNNNQIQEENNLNESKELNKNNNNNVEKFEEKKHLKSFSTIPVYYPILNKSKLINKKNIFINSGLNIIKSQKQLIQPYKIKSYREKTENNKNENNTYIDNISNDDVYYYLKPHYKKLEYMNRHIKGYIEFDRFKDRLKIEMKYHFFPKKYFYSRNNNNLYYKY